MTRSVRFVHAADVHLGAPFGRVSATADPSVADALIASRAQALAALVDLCIEREVDFLVIAGDLFDEGGRNAKAHFDAQRELSRLGEAGIATYLVHGNHDPADAPDFGVAMPPDVRVFARDRVERIEHVRDGEAVCALYGRSFPRRVVRENYVSQVAREAGDALAIGVMHADVGSQDGSTYAPCAPSDLAAAGMDYWALGHIHKREFIGAGTTAGYAGSPQGLDPNEPDAHGCLLVEVSPGTEPAVEFVPLDIVRWLKHDIDLSSAGTVAEVHEAIVAAIEGLRAGSDGRHVVVRLSLVGRSEAHAEMSSASVAEDLLSEARDRGTGSHPWVWVDRIEDDTRLAIDVAEYAARADFLGDLVRLAGDVDPDEILDAAAADLLGKIERDVPRPDAAELLARACEECIDLLRTEATP